MSFYTVLFSALFVTLIISLPILVAPGDYQNRRTSQER